jgi:hypothetical protein
MLGQKFWLGNLNFMSPKGCHFGDKAKILTAGDEPAFTATFSQYLRGETFRVVSVVFGRTVHQPAP